MYDYDLSGDNKMKNLFRKCKANKLLSGKETSPCWFCGIKTQYALTEKDGSEIWCCEGCLWKEGKLKKFKARMGKYSTLKKKSIPVPVLCVKNKEDDHHSINLKDKLEAIYNE